MNSDSDSSRTSSSLSTSSSSEDDGPSKLAKCIQKVSNFSIMNNAFLFDNGAYNPDYLNMIMDEASPKLKVLFDKIEKLDAHDLKKTGKLHKHFIFTSAPNINFGVKIIASAFVAKGFTPAFTNTLNPINSDKLLETKNKNFGVLVSKKIHEMTMNQKKVKATTAVYNARPENVHGELMRFIILDQGFMEGIDLFDVKYVHLFEPLSVPNDQKQAIGRGTRFCGQKSLHFNPNFGWPLYVFRYDMNFEKPINNTNSIFELFLKYSNIDIEKLIFAAELENVVIESAVDKELTKEVHTFKVENVPPIFSRPGSPASPGSRGGQGSPEQQDGGLSPRFNEYKYEHIKLENKCGETGEIKFTPTQEFVRHYFTPSSKHKGILLNHSVGTGKLCTGIATATSSFEKEGYTIVWVTRHTLKSDFWKNIFKQSCHAQFIEEKRKFPSGKPIRNPMKYLSKQWIEPMSYKQFSNMLLKVNKYYEKIVEINGDADPLRKTLLVIDEAHKLYTNIGPRSEKPNTQILEKMIANSYSKSGDESVRVLLMTATPYTEDPMEMIKLLNLLKDDDKMPITYSKFSDKYLKDGYFSANGKTEFKKQIDGLVSYLNRSQDARYFAHPIIEPVYVPISYTDYNKKQSRHIDNRIKEITENIKNEKTNLKETKTICKEKLKKVKANCVDAYKRETKKPKPNKPNFINDCVKENYNCKEADKIEETIKNMTTEKDLFKKKISDTAQENRDISNKIKDINEYLINIRSKITDTKAKKKENKGNKPVIKELNKLFKVFKKEYTKLKAEKLSLTNQKKLNRISIGRATTPNMAVDAALRSKCDLPGPQVPSPKPKATPKSNKSKPAPEPTKPPKPETKPETKPEAKPAPETKPATKPAPKPAKTIIVKTPPPPDDMINKITKYYTDAYDKANTHGRKFILLKYHPDKLPEEIKALPKEHKLSVLYSRIFAQ